MRLPVAIAALALLLPARLLALPAAADPQVYRLSPEAVEQTLETASHRTDTDNPSLLPAFERDNRPHGEVGVMVGSGGARGIYGALGVPLGDSSFASFAFESTQFPRGYGYGRSYGRGLGAGYGDGYGPNLGQVDNFSFGLSLGNSHRSR